VTCTFTNNELVTLPPLPEITPPPELPDTGGEHVLLILLTAALAELGLLLLLLGRRRGQHA
jgi:LPXTG-motif cell wall-anchored protein